MLKRKEEEALDEAKAEAKRRAEKKKADTNKAEEGGGDWLKRAAAALKHKEEEALNEAKRLANINKAAAEEGGGRGDGTYQSR